MRTPRDIYAEYHIPPWLQLHQLRVAAVGKMVCEGFKDSINGDLVVATCLVHDIGAIVKFDFTFKSHETLQNLCPPEDVPYWVNVQKDMRARYGEKEYPASDAIIGELGLERVKEFFNKMGFAKMQSTLAEDHIEALAAQYADMRVGPYGILPLRERLADILARYSATYVREGRSEESTTYLPTALLIEKRLFERSSLRPENITNASVAPIIEELWEYPVA